MSATLVSSNTTIKVNGGGSGNLGPLQSATITAAANEYIICSFASNGTTNVQYQLGGLSIAITPGNIVNTVYISPGTSLVLQSTNITSNSIGYNFTRFINTP